MRLLYFTILIVALFFSTAAAGGQLDLNDQKSKLSYSAGYQVGSDFKRQKTDINPDILMKGIQDALAGSEPVMTSNEMRATLTELQKQIVAVQDQEKKEQAVKNLEEGKAFLLENAEKEGVITLPSGLQYKIIKEGSGKTPGANDTVTVHYKGWLIDGFEFDSSYRRNKPATFPVKGVIAGWTEALQLMQEGSRWQLFIPSRLAYGERSTGRIKPNSTLIFDVELISAQSESTEEIK